MRGVCATLMRRQVWHAVLGYISGFEEQLWELEDDPAAAERMKAAVAAYKGGWGALPVLLAGHTTRVESREHLRGAASADGQDLPCSDTDPALTLPCLPLHMLVAFDAEPVVVAADLVLSTLSLGGPAAAPPLFVVGALSSAPGSGSAMEDWLASVVAGGDGGMEGEGQGEAAGAQEEEEDQAEDELLVPGAGR